MAVGCAVAAGLAGLAFASRGTLARSLTSLGHLNWGWFGLAIGCEGVSLAAFGLSRRRLLRAEGNAAGLGSVMAITYASNALSMSVPFAGTQLAALFSYRQFRRRGLDPALTSWALAVSAIASSSALALVLAGGALASGAPAATAAGFAGAAAFLLPGLAVLLALRYRRARTMLHQFLTRLVSLTERLLRRHLIEADAV
ncbi:MAG: flippase-like domain-containing protein, partial [Actinobacteria bacterium]|nr:flippase-like domain-containing protein [Actinomycetota bacterium]